MSEVSFLCCHCRPGLSEEDRINSCCAAFRGRLDELNAEKYNEVQSHLEAAMTNVIANARWRFVDQHGEKVEKVTPKQPIMWK